MNSAEFKNTVCRICLDENVVVDWDSPLVEYCDVTYEDCYYKYTQLKPIDDDPFSSMLCQICSNSLEGVHALISQALDSYNFLLEVNCMNSEMKSSSMLDDDQNYNSKSFETVLVEKMDKESLAEDHFEYEDFGEFFKKSSVKTENETYQNCTTVEMQVEESSNIENEYEECNVVQTLEFDIIKEEELKSLNAPCRKTKRNNSSNPVKEEVGEGSFHDDNYNKKHKKNEKNCTLVSTLKTSRFDNSFPQYFEESSDNISKNVTVDKEIAGDRIKKQAEVIENNSDKSNLKKRNTNARTRRMCSICSKILHNNFAVKLHEKTHMENRERKETCKVCGLKFYDKRNLYAHKRIHKENREKNHKCEFCNKSFFQKGDLNVHRRIHLGKMMPCNLCTKQFYRQVDLEIHMGTHSATTINSDTKTRSRYFVRCKHCGKSILSTSFKSHTAAHMNEPLMKCSICSKEFFRRESCVLHVKKIHKKTNEEYNDFIIRYKNNRMSHLFLKQNAEIQYTDDKLHAS